MAKAVRVPCSHCCGTGCRDVTGIYLETLRLLRRQNRDITGADLARIDGCRHTAMNNRLAALERLGLVTSYRYGRERLYRAKKSSAV